MKTRREVGKVLI